MRASLGSPNRRASRTEKLYAAWKKAYGKSPFVQIAPDRRDARHRAHHRHEPIDISAVHDPRTNNFILTSAEDNLMKGYASGQAVQIMNLCLCGFEGDGGVGE